MYFFLIFFRDDAKSNNGESEEEEFEFESTTLKRENDFNFNFNFEDRLKINGAECSEIECQNENCDFYSQLQELKRENMEKLQQVIINNEKKTSFNKSSNEKNY